MGARNGQLFDQQIACGVQHLALAEGQFLIAFQHEQVTQDGGNLQHRAGFDFLGIFTVTAVPRLLVDFYLRSRRIL